MVCNFRRSFRKNYPSDAHAYAHVCSRLYSELRYACPSNNFHILYKVQQFKFFKKLIDKNDMVKSRNSDVSTLVPVTTGDMYYTDEE